MLLLQFTAICQNILFPWSIDLAVFFALCILFGSSFKKFFFNNHKKILFFIALASYIALVSVNGSINLSIRELGNKGMGSLILCFIIGVMYTFIISFVCRKFENTFIVKSLGTIGRNSLRLMCIHYPIMILVGDILWHLHINNINCYVLFATQMTTITLTTVMLNKILKSLSSHFAPFCYL